MYGRPKSPKPPAALPYRHSLRKGLRETCITTNMHGRGVSGGGATSAAPKIRSRARGSSLPFQDTGLPQAFPCIRHTGRQAPLVPWHPRGLHGRTPQHTWIGGVARGSPAPIAPTPTSASNFVGGCGCFYGEGLQAPPQPAGKALPGTLVSLAAQKGGREGTDEERQRGERAMGGRGHSLLTWRSVFKTVCGVLNWDENACYRISRKTEVCFCDKCADR